MKREDVLLMAKLSAAQMREIGELVQFEVCSIREVAERYGLTEDECQEIVDAHRSRGGGSPVAAHVERLCDVAPESSSRVAGSR